MISGNMADAGRLRLLITLVFGSIHGFGFAADLLELQLPPQVVSAGSGILMCLGIFWFVTRSFEY